MAKTMIGEAPGVGVVLVNDKAALVIKQSVEDIGGLVSELPSLKMIWTPTLYC
jgi:hypothetical protein